MGDSAIIVHIISILSEDFGCGRRGGPVAAVHGGDLAGQCGPLAAPAGEGSNRPFL